jgi:hypothetical protein
MHYFLVSLLKQRLFIHICLCLKTFMLCLRTASVFERLTI